MPYRATPIAADCHVTIEVAKPDSSKDDAAARTDSGGSLSSSYQLPADAADGTYKVKVLESLPSPATLAKTYFNVRLSSARNPPIGGVRFGSHQWASSNCPAIRANCL